MPITPNSNIGSKNKAVAPSNDYLPDTSNSFERLSSSMEDGEVSQNSYTDENIGDNMNIDDLNGAHGTKRSAANISTSSDSTATRNKQKVSSPSPAEVVKDANAKLAAYHLSKASSSAPSVPNPAPTVPQEPIPLLPPLTLSSEQLQCIHAVIYTSNLAIQIGLDYSEASLARINSDLAQMASVGSYAELKVGVANYILMAAHLRVGIPATAVAKSNTDNSRGSSLFTAAFQGALVTGGLSHREAVDAGSHSAVQCPAEMMRWWGSKVKTHAADKENIKAAFDILTSPLTAIPLGSQPRLGLITKKATSLGYPLAILVRSGDWLDMQYCSTELDTSPSSGPSLTSPRFGSLRSTLRDGVLLGFEADLNSPTTGGLHRAKGHTFLIDGGCAVSDLELGELKDALTALLLTLMCSTAPFAHLGDMLQSSAQAMVDNASQGVLSFLYTQVMVNNIPKEMRNNMDALKADLSYALAAEGVLLDPQALSRINSQCFIEELDVGSRSLGIVLAVTPILLGPGDRRMFAASGPARAPLAKERPHMVAGQKIRSRLMVSYVRPFCESVLKARKVIGFVRGISYNSATMAVSRNVTGCFFKTECSAEVDMAIFTIVHNRPGGPHKYPLEPVIVCFVAQEDFQAVKCGTWGHDTAGTKHVTYGGVNLEIVQTAAQLKTSLQPSPRLADLPVVADCVHIDMQLDPSFTYTVIRNALMAVLPVCSLRSLHQIPHVPATGYRPPEYGEVYDAAETTRWIAVVSSNLTTSDLPDDLLSSLCTDTFPPLTILNTTLPGVTRVLAYRGCNRSSSVVAPPMVTMASYLNSPIGSFKGSGQGVPENGARGGRGGGIGDGFGGSQGGRGAKASPMSTVPSSPSVSQVSSGRSTNSSYLAVASSDHELLQAMKRDMVVVKGQLQFRPGFLAEHMVGLREEVSNKVILEVGKKVYTELDSRIGSQDVKIAGLRSDWHAQSSSLDTRVASIERDLGGMGLSIATTVTSAIGSSLADLIRAELKAALHPDNNNPNHNV